jgi:heat shock protein HslJ
MRVLKTFLVYLALISCSPQSQNSDKTAGISQAAKTAGSEAAPPEGAKIWGSWSIVSITGVPLIEARSGGGGSFPLRLTFTPSGFSANVGCNDFSGQGFLRAGRYHTYMIWSTALGCGELDVQETAVGDIMGNSAPRISFSGDGQLSVTNADKTMVLARDTPNDLQRAQTVATTKPINLVGSVWGIGEIDGTLADSSPTRRQTQFLTFEADFWTATLACGAATGGWHQIGERIEMVGDVVQEVQRCTPEAKAHNAKFMALMKGNPSFGGWGSGRSYDVAASLIAASDDHMMTLGRGAPLDDESDFLLGNWSIFAIDGVKPIPKTAPRLSFSANSYYGTTGCNTISGIFLAHNRFFFTAEGPQTEQGCSGALGAQETRITGLLKSRPSIARSKLHPSMERAETYRLILRDQIGQIELTRDYTNTSALVPMPVKTLYEPPLSVEALMIDGQSIGQGRRAPPTRLDFSALRWEAKLGCNTQSGKWRFGVDGFKGFADPPPYGTPACPAADALWNEKLNRMLDGQSRVLIINGDFLLARHDHWMSGRVIAQ